MGRSSTLPRNWSRHNLWPRCSQRQFIELPDGVYRHCRKFNGPGGSYGKFPCNIYAVQCSIISARPQHRRLCSCRTRCEIRRMQQRLWLRRLKWCAIALAVLFVMCVGVLSRMPHGEAAVGNVVAGTVPFRYWSIQAQTDFMFVYHPTPEDSLSHTAYETHEFEFSPLNISVRGRQIPDVWE